MTVVTPLVRHCTHTCVEDGLQNWKGGLPQNRTRAGGKISTQKWLHQEKFGLFFFFLLPENLALIQSC